MFGAIFRPHARLHARVDAYLDGELRPSEVTRFEHHLSTCETCTAAVVAGRELKTLLASTPLVAAPRSFRLTPAMLPEAAPARVAAVRAAPALRFAQMTAAVAFIGLVAVVTVDLVGTGSSQEDATSASGAAEMSAKDDGGTRTLASDAAGQAPGGGAAAATPAPRDAAPPVLPTPLDSGIGAQSNVTPSANPATNDSKNVPVPATGNAEGVNSYSAAEGVSALDEAPTVAARPGNSGPSTIRQLELALLAVAALAAIAWATFALRSRRS